MGRRKITRLTYRGQEMYDPMYKNCKRSRRKSMTASLYARML